MKIPVEKNINIFTYLHELKKQNCNQFDHQLYKPSL